jgi:hypothetical protein
MDTAGRYRIATCARDIQLITIGTLAHELKAAEIIKRVEEEIEHIQRVLERWKDD